MRDLSPKTAPGQLLPVANSWLQSSGRLLYFGSCRKANSHYSAIAVAGALSRPSPLCRAYRTHDSNLAERLSDLLSDRTQPTVAGGTSSGERQVIRDTVL